jgi:hypothetical protein
MIEDDRSEPSNDATERVAVLAAVLLKSKEVRATKNVNEHLNCTKQGCYSSWT